jgi:antibiotic biosynthesis monooxygenase (ABM) superfamily enzyme
MDAGEHLDHGDGPVTAVIRQAPRAGMEHELEAWMEGIGRAASRFDGFLGRKVIHPARPGRGDYVVILWFDTLADLESWVISPERTSWVARGLPLIDGDFTFQNVGGLGSLFMPARERREMGAAAPPRWKMALVLVVLLYPLVLALRFLYDELLGGATDAVRVAAGVVTSVALVTFVLLPATCRLLRGWLHRGG